MMSNVQVTSFSILGDLNILKNKEPELDVDSIEERKAILYSRPESDDSESNVNIILKLAPNGMYVFTYNLNEINLQRILDACKSDHNEFTLKELRYILRYKLLDVAALTNNDDVFDDSISVNRYELETQLVIEDSGLYYYKVFLNEKIVTADSLVSAENHNGSLSNLSKRLCEFTILESISDDLSTKYPDLNTEDYLYLSCDLNKNKNLQIQLLRTRTESQNEEISFLKRKIETLRKSYMEKISNIEDISIKLLNSKKEKIRLLIEKLEESSEYKNEKDLYKNSLNGLSFVEGDCLNSMVETTDSDADEETGEDEEACDDNEKDKRKSKKRTRKNKEPAKRMKRKFAGKILNRKSESFSHSLADSDSENSQHSTKPMNDYTDTFSDEDSLPVLKEEPMDLSEHEQKYKQYNDDSQRRSESLRQVDADHPKNSLFKKKFVSTPNDLNGPSFESDYKFARQGNNGALNKNHSNYVGNFQQIPEQANQGEDKSFNRSFDENFGSSKDSGHRSLGMESKESFVKQEFPAEDSFTVNSQPAEYPSMSQTNNEETQIDDTSQNMSTDIEDSSG